MKKPAFTMLELVFVIIILGIVSSIAASVLAKIYETHLTQRAIHDLSIKTELAAEQIANRLQFSIPMLTVARDPNVWNDVIELYLNFAGPNPNRTMLEWIGYDNDSFTTAATPGWSGYADLNSSLSAPNHSVRTPGSDLNLTDAVIRNLSENDIGLIGAANQRPNLIFSGDIPFRYVPGGDMQLRIACLGLTNTANTGCTIPITATVANIGANQNDRIDFVNAAAINMGEFYKIAWSAYAIQPTAPRANGTFDLNLISHYQPWQGERWDQDGRSNTLIKNVTVFKFMESADTFRFKLCAKSFISGLDASVSTCKEKVITR